MCSVHLLVVFRAVRVAPLEAHHARRTIGPVAAGADFIEPILELGPGVPWLDGRRLPIRLRCGRTHAGLPVPKRSQYASRRTTPAAAPIATRPPARRQTSSRCRRRPD